MTAAQRDWMLVAPWYRWRRQGVPARESRPVLQKYDTSNPVAAFQADPQHCLKFTDEDLVHATVALPALPALPAPMQGLRRRLTSVSSVPTDIRKVYLDAHKRFYLVVCELHIDDPGFPCVDRREACEAGFVIRRRRTVYPSVAEEEARAILMDLAGASAELARARLGAPPVRMAIVRDGAAGGGTAASVAANTGEAASTAASTSATASATASTGTAAGAYASTGAGALAGSDAVTQTAADAALTQAMAARRQDVERERQRLAEWAGRVGARQLSEGWVPSKDFEGVGSWQEMEPEPADITEARVTLHPLVAADATAKLSADRATLYFGLLPTGSSDTQPDGTARFDDRALYEVRCFVRRHDPRCPKTGRPGDCHGEIVWSAPTEPYRLASHFDLSGTGNRPVTVQLPDLKALEAEAARLPASRAAPLRLQAPADSNLEFDVDASTLKITPQAPGEAICSFAIPLITIVATFVMKLFLPVVVFVFNLWFLLKLRFCIPPSLSVSASLDAALAASGNIDLDVGVQAGLSAEFDANLGPGAGARLTGQYSNGALVQLREEMAIDVTELAAAPGVTAGLEFEEPEPRLAVSIR